MDGQSHSQRVRQKGRIIDDKKKGSCVDFWGCGVQVSFLTDMVGQTDTQLEMQADNRTNRHSDRRKGRQYLSGTFFWGRAVQVGILRDEDQRMDRQSVRQADGKDNRQ